MTLFAKFITVVVAAIISVPALAVETPSDVHITYLSTFNSQGCEAGTVSADASPLGDRLAIRFNKFEVKQGRRLSHCMLDLRFDHPGEWSYAIEAFEFHGRAKFLSARNAEIRVYIDPLTNEVPFSYVVSGPFDGEFTGIKTVESEVWSSCAPAGSVGHSSYTITTVLIPGDIANGSPEFFMLSRDETEEGKDRKLEIMLKWRRCT